MVTSLRQDFYKKKWFIRGTSASPLIERNELRLSEAVANWTLEEYIVKIDKIYCITVANGLSSGAVSVTKNH